MSEEIHSAIDRKRATSTASFCLASTHDFCFLHEQHLLTKTYKENTPHIFELGEVLPRLQINAEWFRFSYYEPH